MAESGEPKRVKAIAHRVYLNRQLRERSGDAHNDWQTAETIAQRPLKRLLFWGSCGLLSTTKLGYRSAKFIAWDIPRWGIFSLPKLEWVKLLAVPLVVAAAGSIITRNFQREAEQNRILKEYFALLETFTFEQDLLDEPLDSGVVLLARGRTVSALRELDLSRRAQLIAFLNASDFTLIQPSGDSETFQEPIISFREQDLSKIDLQGINLYSFDFRDTNFQGTNLRNTFLQFANLQGAKLQSTDLQDADLSAVNLRGAKLQSANLQNSILGAVNLQNADLQAADLQDAFLQAADLQSADLQAANLQDAFLAVANLQDADFQSANLRSAVLYRANLQGADLSEVKGLIEDQLTTAKLCMTILPNNIDVDGDRDCDTP